VASVIKEVFKRRERGCGAGDKNLFFENHRPISSARENTLTQHRDEVLSVMKVVGKWAKD
jgi:hypothetical protein